MALKFPYEIVDLDAELNQQISRNFSDGLPSLVQVGPQKMIISSQFRSVADNYFNFELRPDDVFVLGFPRSGTTLTQDLVWLLFNDLDFKKGTECNSVIDRVPLLEAFAVTTEKTIALAKANPQSRLKSYTSSLETLARMTKRRVIKSHLHFNFLPPNLLTAGCKVIYMARNPKDLVVSLYHLLRNSFGRQFCADFGVFFDYFLSDLIFFTPYWSHLEQAWQHRGNKNFRFFFYEEVTKDLRGFVTDVAEFVGKELASDDLDILEKALSFDQYKQFITQTDAKMNNSDNANDHFIRKGKIGDHKNYFTPEMNERADRWIQENLQKTGIKLPFPY